MVKGNFRVGTEVIVKKTKLPAIIREATAAKTWRIQLVDVENGVPTETFLDNVKSQMLRRPKDDEFPTSQEGLDEDERVDVEAPEIEQTANDPPPDLDIEVQLNGLGAVVIDGEQQRRLSSASSISVASLFEDRQDEALLDDEGSNEDSNAASEELDPDDLEEEDLRQYDEEFGGDALDGVDFACLRGIEKDEEKHRRKFELYLAEKDRLFRENWTVSKGPSKKSSIDIGEKVQERRGAIRLGVIVGDDREDKGPPLWSVLFDGDEMPAKKVPSTRLKLVRDKRTFIWQIAADVVPDNPVLPFSSHGVVGFNFRDKFAATKFETNEGDYDFPFLSLLQHLWPGDWRQHLHRLNTAIADNNDNSNNRRAVSTVSGKQPVYIVLLIATDCSYYLLTCFVTIPYIQSKSGGCFGGSSLLHALPENQGRNSLSQRRILVDWFQQLILVLMSQSLMKGPASMERNACPMIGSRK